MFNKILQKLIEPFKAKIIADLDKIYEKYKDKELKGMSRQDFMDRYFGK